MPNRWTGSTTPGPLPSLRRQQTRVPTTAKLVLEMQSTLLRGRARLTAAGARRRWDWENRQERRLRARSVSERAGLNPPGVNEPDVPVETGFALRDALAAPCDAAGVRVGSNAVRLPAPAVDSLAPSVNRRVPPTSLTTVSAAVPPAVV